MNMWRSKKRKMYTKNILVEHFRRKRSFPKMIWGIFISLICLLIIDPGAFAQKLQLNELGYFEAQGVNVLV
jgi:hypothetical protein